jgi:hypothetical protein
MPTRIAAVLSLALALAPMQEADPPFAPSRWSIDDAGARTVPYLGRPSLFLDNGMALLKTPAFGDGTIEVDIALHGHPSFAGIVFRAEGANDYELIYVRPHLSRQEDALQYTPVFNGFEGWQLYNGKGFTAPAELPVNRWVHLRLVVSGYSARLFVDNAPEPQLVVSDLKRPWARGQIGLWGRFGGANFSNFTFTPADTTAPPTVTPPASSNQLLLDWELSPAWQTPAISDERLPQTTTNWSPVRAEASGLVNIGRFRRRVRTAASASTSRELVFAKTIISSSQPRHARLVFGYSDAVHIFLNGRLLFAGDSSFRSRDPSFLGVASLGPDALYIDLAPGRNELVFAVTENFGGWGFMARLEPADPNLGLDRPQI